MEIIIISAFPEMFDSYFRESLFKRAQKNKIVKFKFIDLKKFAEGKHKKIDDRPFGGGPGMVLQFGPIYKALKSIKSKPKTKIILFGLRGGVLTQEKAKDLSRYNRLILICGRYEGVDERVKENLVDEEISVGSYVLSGGELPAMILSEAVSRFLPGFLGKLESLEDIKGSYPVFTRPEEIRFGKKVLKVPEVLVSGDHKKIKEWRGS